MHLNDFINRTCQTANKQKTSVFICDKAAMQVSSQVWEGLAPEDVPLE